MGKTARLAVGLLAAVFLGGAVPAEAGFIFGRKTRGKIVRTFRPMTKISKIRHIKKGFVGSKSRSPRRTVRKRVVRRRR